jgi:hypothetical protein
MVLPLLRALAAAGHAAVGEFGRWHSRQQRLQDSSSSRPARWVEMHCVFCGLLCVFNVKVMLLLAVAEHAAMEYLWGHGTAGSAGCRSTTAAGHQGEMNMHTY